MGLISFLAIGLIAGWLAGQIMKGKGFGLVGNIVVGVVGAVLGGLLFGLLGLSASGTIGSLVTATVGAVVLLAAVSEESLVPSAEDESLAEACNPPESRIPVTFLEQENLTAEAQRAQSKERYPESQIHRAPISL